MFCLKTGETLIISQNWLLFIEKSEMGGGGGNGKWRWGSEAVGHVTRLTHLCCLVNFIRPLYRFRIVNLEDDRRVFHNCHTTDKLIGS